jgi:hypothetical protein
MQWALFMLFATIKMMSLKCDMMVNHAGVDDFPLGTVPFVPLVLEDFA